LGASGLWKTEAETNNQLLVASFSVAEKSRKPVYNKKLRRRKNRASITSTQNLSEKFRKINIDIL
jgi:hypothetical protein